MKVTDKILIISDDEKNEIVNRFHEFLKDTDNIEVIYGKSDLNCLKTDRIKDYYVIFIDYDNLNVDINMIVSQIRSYLHSLPLIDVMSYDKSIFKRTQIPHVSFLDKNHSDETIHNQLINFIKQMKFSRSVNDVSHLPGNFVINEILETKIRNNDNFAIMYLDIDKFKAFYDYYGIYRSSMVIQYLSNLIIELIEKYGAPEDFIGHIGGDDFVIICSDYENSRKIGEKIIEEFDANISRFYDDIDVQRNYIEVLNRNGDMEKYPFVTISIVSITNEKKDFSNTDEVYKEMMVVKKQAKQTMGSILVHNTH